MDEQTGNNPFDENTPPKLTPGMNPLTAAFLALAVVFILYQFGGAILTLLIFGLDFEKANVNSVRLLTMGGQILFILLPALLFAKFVYTDVTSTLRVKLPSMKEVIVFIGGLVLLTPLLQSFLYIQNFLFNKLADSISVVHAIRNLIDEIDKSDNEFEAFLLEILSDFQVSVPEIDTIRAETKPFVFLTSNNTRELSEALKRRCLHLFIPLPDPELEREIIRIRVPGISEKLRIQLVSFIQHLRELDLKKIPSISETIDWARVLLLLHADKLSADLISETLHIILKFEGDIKIAEEHLYEMTRKAIKEAAI